ncbi:MAG: AAA family ATPase [Bacteroidales bacterium]|nr:AAA family ATPase [Lentimicrobiaceae bacterium]MDD5695286.1 AAA family ATPase [Bacteroidales bacterium]
MKIIQIRFKNLNSLVGEWSIDFTSPEYIEDGIFAISGPTGSGKSTILDAISLALYGCTPRLSTISKSTNEIMSRQTGECFAEVVFETDEGQFRAHWSQHRARNKANGELQAPRHEIAEAGSGHILASQLRTTEEVVVSKTGMDFKRFTQSMMLAQGGFAAFLQATPDERAPILEQITGTEIYSSISRHVFERQKEERGKLDALKAEMTGIVLLNPEEEEQVKKSLEEKNREKDTLSAKIDQIGKAINCLNKIGELKNDLQHISLDQETLDHEFIAFEPQKEILKRAQKAVPLDAEFSALTVLRDLQMRDLGTLSSLQRSLPELAKELARAQENFKQAEKVRADAENEKDKFFKLTTRVRLLDQDIAQKKNALEMIRSQIARLNQEKKKEEAKRSEAQSSISNLNLESAAINAYLDACPQDEELITEFTGIKASVQSLLESQRILAKASSDLSLHIRSLEEKKSGIQRIETELYRAKETNRTDQQNVTDAQSTIDQLLDKRTIQEIIRRKDELVLYLAELRKIANLGSERNQLEDGKPCPLCGSLHHPYAEGNVPRATESEKEFAALIHLIREHEEADRRLSLLMKQEIQSASAVNRKQQELELAVQSRSGIEENIVKGKVEVKNTAINTDRAVTNLVQLLEPFGIRKIPGNESEAAVMMKTLEVRKNEWQKKSARKTEVDRLITSEKAALGASDSMITSKENDIRGKEKESRDLETSLNNIRQDRANLFGDKDVNDEETRSLSRLNEARDVKDRISASFHAKEKEMESHNTRINNLVEETRTRSAILEKDENHFKEHLLTKGFGDEREYKTCSIPAEERAELEEKDNDLRIRQVQLVTRRKEKDDSLQLEQSKKLTEEDIDTLQEKLNLFKANHTAVVEETGALNQKLKANQENRIRGSEISRRIDLQDKEHKRWAALSGLIGSADGKKYRNFAQGLTLEIMVSYANIQLAKLSDRYLLTRGREDPLELKVIDNYQAGEIRSTKNLSGGESFIVSMALALGLSGMSSRNVRVDSLFLDEGFGSLDEDALEAALSTLASLRQEGKMIGVISHVGAMKERINTQIVVRPVREGRSVLSGPGCTTIDSDTR